MIKIKIPIYIISYNRLDALKKSIHSYLNHFDYSQINIIDNGSDYKPLVKYYKTLTKKGVKIFYNNKLNHVNDLTDKIAPIIEGDLINRNRPPYYIVTDPDIALKNVDHDFLNVLVEMFEKFKHIEVVGPMLTINDIPKNYPAKNLVIKKHTKQFWMHFPKKIRIKSGKNIYYQEALIDTTFALHKSTQPFRRLKKGIRLYAPYEAKHLDWYITNENITHDQLHFLETTNNKISHWLGANFHGEKNCGVILDSNIYIVKNSKVFKFNINSGKTESISLVTIIILYVKKNIKKIKNKIKVIIKE